MNETDSDRTEEIATLRETIKGFIHDFKNQNATYRLVWGARVLLWILLLTVALLGMTIRIINFFK